MDVNTQFLELSTDEMIDTDGGVNWVVTVAGTAVVVAAAGVAIAMTGGAGLVPITVLLGAGTAGEVATAGALCAASAVGGMAAGCGLAQ